MLEDDFLSGTTGNGTIGALGWGTGSGTLLVFPSTINNPGIVQKGTTTTINTVATLQLMTQNNSTIFPTYPHTVIFIASPMQVDVNTVMRIGAFAAVSSNPPFTGIYFEKLGADTTWFGVIQIGGVSTRVNTNVPVTTEFSTFKYEAVANTVIFYINNVNVAQLSGLPTLGIDPAVQIINLDALDKTIQIDYFQLYLTGLTRL
jgi:hypothetical protein